VWAELDEAERGVVLAAVLAETETPLARIAGDAARRCRRALDTLRGADRQTRQRQVAQLTAQLLGPLPAGLELVDPDWIEHRLSQQPPPVATLLRAALDDAAPPRGAQRALTWRLCREVLGPLTSSPATASFFRWRRERLRDALTGLGCLVLAAHARRADRPLRLQLLFRLAPPFDAQLRAALARERLPRPPPSLPVGWQRAEELLLTLGGDLLCSVLTPLEQRALARRLPRAIGLQLLGDSGGGDRQQVIRWLQQADRPATGAAR